MEKLKEDCWKYYCNNAKALLNFYMRKPASLLAFWGVSYEKIIKGNMYSGCLSQVTFFDGYIIQNKCVQSLYKKESKCKIP